MLRPNVRKLLKDLSALEVTSELEVFIKNNPKEEFYLANIDLLRMYGKSGLRDKFYKLALFLVSNINNPAVYREIARFSYFIEKDAQLAELYASKAIKINEDEPLWVYYIARQPKVYFEKLYEGIYLTSIPKNASTSLKAMVLEKLHNKVDVNPHSIFGNPFFNSNTQYENLNNSDLKLLSIREPISRFVSYYNKNIIEELSLKEELNYTNKENAFDLSLTPTLEEFTDKLNLYCYNFNDVLHHVLPQTAYFNDISSYDCVADIQNAHVLGEAVTDKLKLKNKIMPPKKMVSTKKVNSISISPEVKNILQVIFYDDIKMYQSKKNIDKKYSFSFEG